jgi:alkylation response protein AidB-like acyl-CoA dehydrogenase
MQIPEPRNYFTSHADRQFVFEHLDWELFATVWPDVDLDIYRAVLAEVGKVTGGRIAQNAPRANNQAEVDDLYWVNPEGEVFWPDAIKDSYAAFTEAELHRFSIAEQYRGMGLPDTLGTFLREMTAEADAGFATIPMLSDGVAGLLARFGGDELKDRYLPGMASGELAGCMDLTEPQAGSDLGALTTAAVTKGDTTYITGNKIFITSGGAQLHMVIARDADTKEATQGTTKGISLYLVPTVLPDGTKNDVKVTGLEHKMGIESSPTCSISFGEDGEGAVGYLVGKKGQGFYHMLHLMNHARLGVAGQALGILEAGLRKARAYAAERRQFKQPIVNFGMVKEMLVDMQVYSEMIRAVVVDTAFASDMAHALEGKEDTVEEYARYANQTAVMTPLIKYVATEKAIELSRTAIQVHGGVGYITETGVEQHLRDAVITAIYEGTSEIQATLFLKDTLSAIMPSFKSRANPGKLFDAMGEDLGSGEWGDRQELATALLEVKKIYGAAVYHAGVQMMRLVQSGMDQPEAFNRVSPVAKPLVNLATELYGAYLLFQQAEHDDRKMAVATTFIKEKLVPNAQRYVEQVKVVGVETLERYDHVLDVV